MVKPITYENPPVSLNFSTTNHERNQGKTNQPGKIRIKTPKIDDEAMLLISLASVSCTQQNKDEDRVSQKESITRKEQIQELTTKYIPPHLRKVD
jgi:hypothetical protein